MKKILMILIGFGILIFMASTHVQIVKACCGDDECPSIDCSCSVSSCDIGQPEGMCKCADPGDPECFLPGTKVRVVARPGQDEVKNIEDIKIGDRVTSFEDGKLVESTVSNIYKVVRDFYYELTAGNNKVKATAEHPFYVGNNIFKEISKLKAGDTVYVEEADKLTPKVISSNIKIDKPTDAYNLSVNNSETFFANNFAVHNKCFCGLCFDPDQDKDVCCPHPYPNNCDCKGFPVYTYFPALNMYCLQGMHPERWVGGTDGYGAYVDGGCYGDMSRPGGWQKGAECGWQCTGRGEEEECSANKWISYAYHCVINDGYILDSCGNYVPPNTSTPTPTPTPTCGITGVPASLGSITIGGSTTFGVTISPANGTFVVNFSSGSGITVNPSSSNSLVTVVTVTSNSTGVNIPITASVVMAGAERCTATTTITVTNPGPWWQVKDGDVTTNQNISSLVPTGQLFDTVGSGGFPGVPVYGTSFNLTADSTKISVPKWNANTTTTQSRIFDYSYFKNLIPSDVISGNVYSDGYRWTMITGNYVMPTTNFGTEKVILFVDENLTINGNINLTDNQGFFAVFVNGSISVNPTVTSIEGIYLTDDGFSTGAGNTQLHTRGSIASFGGISLERNLLNNLNPAELFEYAPDQVLLFPEKLGFRRTKWVEVAP